MKFRPMIMQLAMLFALGGALTAAAGDSGDLAAASQPTQIRQGSLHLGTYIETTLTADREETARRLSALAQSELERYENEFSVHRFTPMTALNSRAGEFVAVTPEAAELIRAALAIAEQTQGAFDPTVGPLAELWKIGFGGHRIASDDEIREAKKAVDYRRVRIREENGLTSVKLGEGQRLDLGGIAKGYVGMKLKARLVREGLISGLLNLGGDVIVIGERAPGQPWQIGLQWPERTRGACFAVVRAADVSVVTSGGYERYFDADGRRFSHIINPATGRPVQTDLSSVSVIDADATRADGLCTAFFVMGLDASRRFLSRHPDIEAVLLDEQKSTAYVTPGAARALEKKDPSIRWVTIER